MQPQGERRTGLSGPSSIQYCYASKTRVALVDGTGFSLCTSAESEILSGWVALEGD